MTYSFNILLLEVPQTRSFTKYYSVVFYIIIPEQDSEINFFPSTAKTKPLMELASLFNILAILVYGKYIFMNFLV